MTKINRQSDFYKRVKALVESRKQRKRKRLRYVTAVDPGDTHMAVVKYDLRDKCVVDSALLDWRTLRKSDHSGAKAGSEQSAIMLTNKLIRKWKKRFFNTKKGFVLVEKQISRFLLVFSIALVTKCLRSSVFVVPRQVKSHFGYNSNQLQQQQQHNSEKLNKYQLKKRQKEQAVHLAEGLPSKNDYDWLSAYKRKHDLGDCAAMCVFLSDVVHDVGQRCGGGGSVISSKKVVHWREPNLESVEEF